MAARGFGEALGVAFQLKDDYLGVWGAAATLGKPQGDLGDRKRSLPMVLATARVPSLSTLLARPAGDGEATTALFEALEGVGARDLCEVHVERILQMTAHTLSGLTLAPEWEARFNALVEFVVNREA